LDCSTSAEKEASVTGAVFVLVPGMALSVLPFKIPCNRHLAGHVAFAEDRCPINPASLMSASP
jgi:hypothetical protein